MRRAHARMLARCLAVLAVAVALVAGTWRFVRAPAARLVDPLLDQIGGRTAAPALSFDHTLTGVCACVLLACVLWLAATTVVVTLEAATGVLRSRAGDAAPPSTVDGGRLCPRTVRRFVLVCCGVAVAGGLSTSPSVADGPLVRPADRVQAPAAAAPVLGLGVPDRTEGGPPGHGTTVRVGQGDCLWSIAERLLPPGASNAQVTRAWRALHHVNRARIGGDPHLIFPGTPLEIPRPYRPA